MSSRRLSSVARPSWLALTCFCLAAPVAAAPLGPDDAVVRAAERDPGLRAALLAAEQAQQAVVREAHGFVPTLTAEVGYTRSTTPSLGGDGINLAMGHDLTGRLALSKPFAVGTTVSAELGFNTAARDVVQPFLAQRVTVGPTYGLNLTLRLTQPLLRGFGRAAGEAALGVAGQARTAAERARLRTASALARDVRTAWWQLWAAQAAQAIQVAALAVAERQLDETRQRVDAGALPPTDTLPLRTQVAQVREALASARSLARQRTVALARLIEGDAAAPVAIAAEAPPLPPELPPAATVAAEARAAAPDLAELAAAVEQARIQADAAANQALPALDASAWVSAAGLGDQSLGDAVGMTATGEALSGYVGLSLSLPVVGTGRAAEAERARLAERAARARLQQAREAAEAQAVQQLEGVAAAQAQLAAATATAAVAAESAEAARARHQAGADTALAWVVAEQDRRAAALRVAQARADVAIGQAALDHLTGRLLPTP
ncbi:MAG: TolC family protein [Myxococcales bacterium]|nr:TolC family protein [Myxococcales bacterium]